MPTGRFRLGGWRHAVHWTGEWRLQSYQRQQNAGRRSGAAVKDFFLPSAGMDALSGMGPVLIAKGVWVYLVPRTPFV